MALVKVKEKYQVTLPAALRAKAGVSIGDVLEVKYQGNQITLTPKSVVDRQIASVAAALASVQNGAQVIRVHDVAATADALKVWRAAGLCH